MIDEEGGWFCVGIGAAQAVSQEAYFTAVESVGGNTTGIPPEIGAPKRHDRFLDLKAITGAALALTSEDHSHEQVVQCAITGAAVSTAANLLTGIF
ncbi:hypothetical protein ACJIZ3_019906 [Penstemon smallii]|uniref:Uncharacterized protein n=1 Tax=Penstemon smallii TaxID=265156 RepID=A0ABD3T2I0_9LAMI